MIQAEWFSHDEVSGSWGGAVRVYRSGPVTIAATVTGIDGRALSVTDPLGRQVSTMAYALTGRAWLTDILDHGPLCTVLDPLDGVCEQHDAKGAVARTQFDPAHRPVRVQAADQARAPLTVREIHVYGDAAGLPDAAARNLLGRPYQDYDEAGLVTIAGYDLHGKAWRPPGSCCGPTCSPPRCPRPTPVDWTNPAGLLDPAGHAVTAVYDALGRRKQVTYPQDAQGHRLVASATYGRAGHLVTLIVGGQPYIERIFYNARGQRTLLIRGNGVMTRYAYDPLTFQLARLRSEGVTGSSPTGWSVGGTVHQDHGYEHDLVGNMLRLHDRTPGCGIPPGPADALDREFRYDPLYRLLSATGRECGARPAGPPWLDIPRCTDVTRATSYLESYGYDDAGNLLTIGHTGAATRTFTSVPDGNRLATMAEGQTAYFYTYDACGNLTGEVTDRHFVSRGQSKQHGRPSCRHTSAQRPPSGTRASPAS